MFENSNVNIICNSCEDMACCSSECVLTFLFAGDNIQYVNEQFVSCIHFFFSDRMTGQKYLDFVQNE